MTMDRHIYRRDRRTVAPVLVCNLFDHVIEGHVRGERLMGRCARCGIGVMKDTT
jgi:hypothetical protein